MFIYVIYMFYMFYICYIYIYIYFIYVIYMRYVCYLASYICNKDWLKIKMSQKKQLNLMVPLSKKIILWYLPTASGYVLLCSNLMTIRAKRKVNLNLICMKYFPNFTTWNGSSRTHRRKCSITIQNDFSFT